MNADWASRLTRAAFMQYDNKGLNILKQYAALKGLVPAAGMWTPEEVPG